MNKGKLFLIPVPISQEQGIEHITEFSKSLLKSINYFIAENAKTCRMHLKLLGYDKISEARIEELNKHEQNFSYSDLLKPIEEGNNIAFMSEAGCPAIADPGAEVVAAAHQKNIQVIAIPGPSSILLSIMASGFRSQSFAFVSYLPIEKNVLQKKIKALELISKSQNQSQYFIETPYRSVQLFETLLSQLSPDTNLFVGINLTGNNEFVMTKKISEWRLIPKPNLNKIPTVFGLFA